MRILTRKEFQDDMAKEWSKAVEAEYKAQIEEAVLAEREACAKLCESLPMQQEIDVRDQAAAAIRARGEQA
jgi:hypothetical protein